MDHQFDQLKGGILITDAKGRILYANQVLTSNKGLSLEKMKGKPPGNLWGGHMDDRFYKNLWQTIKERKKSFFGKVKNIDTSGQKKWENLHIAPIVGSEGEVEYFLAIQPQNEVSSKQLQREMESVVQGQQKHPEDLWALLQDWMGPPATTQTPKISTSPAHFIENLLEEHAGLHLNEDATLIELAKSDSTYFHRLYEKYQAKIFNYFLYRVGGDIPMAEDLTQEVFMRAFNALAHFEYQELHYLSYLLAIAHNLLVNYYRMIKPILMDDWSLLNIQTDSTAQNQTELRLVWEAVNRLAPIERIVLTMKYGDDLSIKEMAHILNKSENAVKLHLSRARRKLREFFSK